MDWYGSVYSTTNYTHDVLDRLTNINQQGQTRALEYDGHGRLWHKTTPEQGTTTYVYNADDTPNLITDARGAKTSYGYDMRHLLLSVNYDTSGVFTGQNVAATAGVSYTYDAARNRTLMTDGMGSATYHYNNLGQMDWEQRTFNTGTGSTSGITYRAFGGVKGTTFNEGTNVRTLVTAYDNRMRLTKWDVPGVLGYKYYYNDFNERTGRVTYAQSITGQNSALDRSQTSSPEDRSYEYDHLGRLAYAHSGAESKAHAIGGPWGIMDGPYSQGYEYDAYGNMTHRYEWGGEVQGFSPGVSTDFTYAYTNNRRTGSSYDNAGNLTFDGGQHFTYDAEGRQTAVDWTDLHSYYDGDGLRVKKTENGSSLIRYYLRSTVLGGRVLAEINNVGRWQRGYVYGGAGLLAIQQNGVFLVHEDPVTKSRKVTSKADGSVQSTVELDPRGADTSHSSNSAFQPRKLSTCERDSNGSDDAMMRRYNRWHSRFDQPDPYDGSYDLSDP